VGRKAKAPASHITLGLIGPDSGQFFLYLLQHFVNVAQLIADLVKEAHHGATRDCQPDHLKRMAHEKDGILMV
jgi:hypothetical protein